MNRPLPHRPYNNRTFPKRVVAQLLCAGGLSVLSTSCSSDGIVAHWQRTPHTAAQLLGETTPVIARVREAFSPASPTPVVLDIIIDASPGSPGADKALVRPSITAIATVLAGIPGNIVRYWNVGDDASRTTIITTVTITTPKAPGRSAAQAHQASEQRRILAAFDSLTLTTPKRSPLFSSVERVLQETRPSGTRHVVLLDSDLLEHSDLGDLECDNPTPAAWQARLDTARLFRPGTMRESTVIAVNTGLRPVANQRCPATVAHHIEVIDDWVRTVKRAGATFNAITSNLTNEEAERFLNPKETK